MREGRGAGDGRRDGGDRETGTETGRGETAPLSLEWTQAGLRATGEAGLEGQHGHLVAWALSLLLGLLGRPPGRLSSMALQALQAPSLGQLPGALEGKCPDPRPLTPRPPAD